MLTHCSGLHRHLTRPVIIDVVSYNCASSPCCSNSEDNGFVTWHFSNTKSYPPNKWGQLKIPTWGHLTLTWFPHLAAVYMKQLHTCSLVAAIQCVPHTLPPFTQGSLTHTRTHAPAIFVPYLLNWFPAQLKANLCDTSTQFPQTFVIENVTGIR